MRNVKNFLIVTTFILLFVRLGLSQTYEPPRELKIAAAVRKTFPGYYGSKFRYSQLENQKFYPIGWSRDGKFAYYYEPVDEACGCYFANLVIQDMRTDKVVWEFEYDQGKLIDDKGEMPPEDNIRKLWAKNRKLFSEKLAENKIVAGSAFQLMGKTFTSSGRSYTAKSSIKMGKNSDDDDRVSIFDITLSTPGLGSKKIYTLDNTKAEYNNTLDARVMGAIRSPYENRVAIISIEVGRGWEGPPHNGNIIIAGADLTGGFRKQV